MALIKLGAIVTALSGKVGGQSFANSSNGAYLKNIGSYINKITSKRKKANQMLALITSSWRALDPNERETWKVHAPNFPYTNRVGDVAYLSGFGLYTQFNYNLVSINKLKLKNAPPISAKIPPNNIQIVVAGGKVELKTTGGDGDVICSVFISSGMSQGNTQYLKLIRRVILIINGDMFAFKNVNADFEAVFGPYIIGCDYYVHAKFFDGNSGQPLGTFLSNYTTAKP